MQGKIIVIEGLDGCGKSTQLELLKERFTGCRFITFPNYDSPSGELVTQYLHGEFHEEDAQRSAYSASAFYAVDRYASFKKDWESDYLSGKTIISARYTTSNAFYQMTKLDRAQWEEYCRWLYDFEYGRLGIPRPDAVIFLDVPVEVSQRLLTQRYEGNEGKKDIHEADVEYLKKCRDAVMYAYENRGTEHWHMIACCENDALRPISSIHEELVSVISGIM
ncbi:MAG: deoxynucleoside kinase [Oscillospiraceae bacterium]|nr:deoxynucleoside kinase [Oscillospiraceae bacterium]